MSNRRIVVTGLGAVSGNGLNVAGIWHDLSRGIASRVKITPEYYFDVERFEKACRNQKEGIIDTVCGVPLKNEEIANLLGIDNAGRYDRHQLFGLLAGREAMSDSGLIEHTFPERFGCVVATGDGGLNESFQASELLIEGGRLTPYSNLRHLPSIFGSWLARKYRLCGPSYVHSTACAASAHAIIHACDLIKLGRADAILCGGTEAAITPLGIASFCAQRALSNHSRPYQKDRSGFLMGEGSAMLVVEEYEHAIRRGAFIYAEIAGYGATTDGDPSCAITEPRIQGGINSAKLALEMGGIQARQVGYINSHGTGTPIGDLAELAGILSWIDHSSIPLVSSTKAYSGHLLGAAGAYEALLTITMLFRKIILPTHELTREKIDPACNNSKPLLLFDVKAREIKYALSNSFGFGGTNASILFRSMS